MLHHVQRFKIYRIIIRSFSPNYIIAETDPRDIVLVNRLFNNEAPEQIENSDKQATNFVAKHKNRILGIVQLVRHDKSYAPHEGYWLCGLFILPMYRGMGIGEALSLHVINRVYEEGVSELFLQVNQKNRAAITMYSKLGFTEDCPRKSYGLLKERQSGDSSYVILKRTLI